MFAYLSRRMVESAISSKAIRKEDEELYLFGYQLLLAHIATIATLLILGAVSGRLFETVVYTLLLFPLRIFAGGFHQRTQESCYISSVLAFAVVMALLRFLGDVMLPIHCAISFLVSAVVIIALAPLEDPNKPLSGQECKRYRTITRTVLLLEALLFAAAYFCGVTKSILSFMALAPITVAILLLLSRFGNSPE